MLAIGLTVALLLRFKSLPARSALTVVLAAYVGTIAYFGHLF